MAKRYSPKLKFQVVLEVLQDEKSADQVTKIYSIHSNTINNWKQTFLEKGPNLFALDSTVTEYERRLAELEQLLGKKEMEIALLKNLMMKMIDALMSTSLSQHSKDCPDENLNI